MSPGFLSPHPSRSAQLSLGQTRRMVFIAQLLASSFERLLCTTTLLNAWCVLSCLVGSPWGRCDFPRFRVESAEVPRFSEAT